MISGGREQVTYHQYRSLWNHVERGFCGQAGQINIRDLPVTSEPLGATCGTRRGVFCRKRIARFLDFILWTGEKKKTHGRHERGLREKRSRSGFSLRVVSGVHFDVCKRRLGFQFNNQTSISFIFHRRTVGLIVQIRCDFCLKTRE